MSLRSNMRGEVRTYVAHNLGEDGTAIRMRAGSRDAVMIALRLDRRKPLLMVPSCDCRASIATQASKLRVQSLPLWPLKRRPAVKMSPVSNVP